ncbi:MAG: two-component regulator propeller domain-containing protein [Flavobacterium sp.]|nr:two-component regulator propeller domain-containing protein [Flavobacterium sp.]
MMTYKQLFTLLLISILYSACKQSQTLVAPEIIKPANKNLVNPYGPNRMVRSVKQAKNGDILIASYSGVWRYNGKLFTNITTAISTPSFWDVLEDKKGNLWFGTKDSGVYCYNGVSILHYTTRQGLASNTVLHIYEDKAGNIWLGSSRYDGKSFKNFTTKDGFPSNNIRLLLEDKTGKLWFGAQGENLFVYDGKTYTVLKNKDGQPFYNVWGITEDRKGNIWFGASIIKEKKGSTIYLDGAPGVWRYDGSNFTKALQMAASAIVEDKHGNIWTAGAANSVGFSPWKLLRYHQQSLYNAKPSFTEIASINNMLCKIVEANDGSIWFGSGKGVYCWDGKTMTNFMPTKEHIYQINTKESLITWKGSMKISAAEKHVGTVAISNAELWVENNRLVGGNVVIDMNSMAYGNKKDTNTPIQHLQSADYFDVKRFPFASIEIAEVDSLSANTVQITSYLTIKSVTHLVFFPATIHVKNGILNASAKLTIDRTNWGINYKSGKLHEKFADQIVSDEIEFDIKIVAKK